MSIASINPATGVLEKSFAPHSDSEVERKLATLSRGYHFWKHTSFKRRAEYIRAVSEALQKNREKAAELITGEMGKPISQSLSEIDKCVWVCEYYAKHAEEFLKPVHIKTEAKKSYVRFDPTGIILAVMPWNFPFWQVFRAVVPAIMAGNVVLLKHASNVPQCALFIEKIMKTPVVEEPLFGTILVEGGAVNTIVADSRIAGVTVTGSETAGMRVAEQAGAHIKKSVLELGGSDPFIVLGDADVEKAAGVACTSRLINTGQTCISAKRFIVDRKVVKDFTKYLVRAMKAQVVGDPTDPDTQIGPLARQDLVSALDTQVTQSVEMGAQIALGGKPADRPGYYYEPTVLTHVTKGMPGYDEELFGPVACIIAVKDADEAVAVANDSRYGLGASIWTKDIKKAEELAVRLEAGAVFINDFVKSDPRLPFGGIKKSGYGRELGEAGIKEFVNAKTVVVEG